MYKYIDWNIQGASLSVYHGDESKSHAHIEPLTVASSAQNLGFLLCRLRQLPGLFSTTFARPAWEGTGQKSQSVFPFNVRSKIWKKKKKLPAWECRGRVTKKHFFKMVWFLFSYRKYLKYKGLKGKRGRGKPHCSIDHTNFHVSIHTCSFSFNSIFQPHFTLQHAILYLYIADLILIPLTKRNFQQNYSLRRARGGKRNREDGLELLVKAHGAAVNPALFAMCIPLPPITFN